MFGEQYYYQKKEKKHSPQPHLAPSPSPMYYQPQPQYQPQYQPQPQQYYPQQPQPQYQQQQYYPQPQFMPQPSPHLSPHPSPQPSPHPSPSLGPTYPQQQPQQSYGPRTLHVYHGSFTDRHSKILDTDKATPLYTIDNHAGGWLSSKPSTRIYSSATGTEIGSISFHSLSSSIDLTVHGRAVQLKSTSMWSSNYEFFSAASPGQRYTWKYDGLGWSGNMTCADGNGHVVARWDSSGWAMKKDGKFEILGGVAGGLMDEVVVAALAVIQRRKRQSASAAGGAAGAC